MKSPISTMIAKTQHTTQLCSLDDRMTACLQKKPSQTNTQWITDVIVNLVYLRRLHGHSTSSQKAAGISLTEMLLTAAGGLAGRQGGLQPRALRPLPRLPTMAARYGAGQFGVLPIMCLGFALAQCSLAILPLHSF